MCSCVTGIHHPAILTDSGHAVLSGGQENSSRRGQREKAAEAIRSAIPSLPAAQAHNGIGEQMFGAK
jgi:hypothetical protein